MRVGYQGLSNRRLPGSSTGTPPPKGGSPEGVRPHEFVETVDARAEVGWGLGAAQGTDEFLGDDLRRERVNLFDRPFAPGA